MTVTCIVCGKEFSRAPGSTARTCRSCGLELMQRSGRQPRRPNPGRTFVCQQCGRTFTTDTPGRLRTCSPECLRLYMSRKASETAAKKSAMHRMTKICPVCGKQFEVLLSRNTVCCSRRCALQRGKRGKSATCVVCGRTFFPPKSLDCKACSPECRRILKSSNAKKRDHSRMHEGLRNNPKMISSPQHFLAREWALRAPDGTEYRFRNLNFFVRTHKELFPPEQLREHKKTPLIASRLAQLAPWRQSRHRRTLSIYGWTWAD